MGRSGGSEDAEILTTGSIVLPLEISSTVMFSSQQGLLDSYPTFRFGSLDTGGQGLPPLLSQQPTGDGASPGFQAVHPRGRLTAIKVPSSAPLPSSPRNASRSAEGIDPRRSGHRTTSHPCQEGYLGVCRAGSTACKCNSSTRMAKGSVMRSPFNYLSSSPFA